MAKNKIEKLRSLAQLDVDAIGTYDAALERINVPILKEKLGEFRADHERHVDHLNRLIVLLGGEKVERKADAKGAVLKGFTAITAMMGNEAALLAMMGNEELTTHTYQAALKAEWNTEEKELISRHYDDERRHLEWIKDAAKNRRWASADEGVHP
jgi:rubrerythrin